MRYFKANKNIIDGNVVYGNLPVNFVIGYETENEAYFQLLPEITLPDQANVTEISEDEFHLFVDDLNKSEQEKRKQDEVELLDQLEQSKFEKEQLWQMVTDLQLEQMMIAQQLTDAQLEIEMLKGGN